MDLTFGTAGGDREITTPDRIRNKVGAWIWLRRVYITVIKTNVGAFALYIKKDFYLGGESNATPTSTKSMIYTNSQF